MSNVRSVEELRAMINSYEELLRRLIAEADDEEKLFEYRQSRESAYSPTCSKAARIMSTSSFGNTLHIPSINFTRRFRASGARDKAIRRN